MNGFLSLNCDFIISFCEPQIDGIGNGTRCHENVILIAMNGDQMRTKGEQRRRK